MDILNQPDKEDIIARIRQLPSSTREKHIEKMGRKHFEIVANARDCAVEETQKSIIQQLQDIKSAVNFSVDNLIKKVKNKDSYIANVEKQGTGKNKDDGIISVGHYMFIHRHGRSFRPFIVEMKNNKCEVIEVKNKAKSKLNHLVSDYTHALYKNNKIL